MLIQSRLPYTSFYTRPSSCRARFKSGSSYAQRCHRLHRHTSQTAPTQVIDCTDTRHRLHRHTSQTAPTHVTDCTDTRHRLHRHTSQTAPTHVTDCTDTRHRLHRHTSQTAPTHVTDCTDTRHRLHRHTSQTAPTHVTDCTDTRHRLHRPTSQTDLFLRSLFGMRHSPATQCDCPSGIPNAEIQYTERDPGSIANYTCLAGYSSHDISANIVCLDNGHWSPVLFECKPCDEPPGLENAEIDVGTVTVGSIRHYTCYYGMGMYGSGSVTCQADSTWSTLDSQCFELMNVALKRKASLSTSYEAGVAEADRLSNLLTLVGETENESDMTRCAFYVGPGEASVYDVIPCDEPVSGRFIKVTGGGQIGGSCGEPHNFIQLCEFEAIGFYPGPIPCTESEFECPTKLCISSNLVCDQANDCGDSADEDDCCE
ncbi:hypothetical protein ScPMuIL_007012 [Solemya velum]